VSEVHFCNRRGQNDRAFQWDGVTMLYSSHPMFLGPAIVKIKHIQYTNKLDKTFLTIT